MERMGEGTRRRVVDVVAAEEPLEIRLVSVTGGNPPDPPSQPSPLAGGRGSDDEGGGFTRVSITMRTPGHDFELAVGFLYTEGIIHSGAEIERVSYCVDGFVEQQYNVVNVYLRAGVDFDGSRLARNFYSTSSCGVCGKASLEALRVQGCRRVSNGPIVAAAVLEGLPAKLRLSQAIFEETGGLHAAGLFDPDGNLLLVREDVGRHNAVDKVVGERVLGGRMPLEGCLLLVSGRASFEIMQKAAVAGIPLVAAVGAPSSLAVDTAREFGMTLVGFLRERGFNVYAGPERVL